LRHGYGFEHGGEPPGGLPLAHEGEGRARREAHHVDPRFTRTSAMADIYAPVRAGSDIVFLGGIINYVINNERWQKDDFFQTWLIHYTNAATIIDAGYEDAEDNNGVFSGLMEYTGGVKEWPYNGFIGQYKNDLWQYKRQGGATGIGAEGTGAGYTAKSGEVPGHTGQPGSEAAKPAPMGPRSGQIPDSKAPGGPPFDPLVNALVKPPIERDEKLQHPRCVFQIIKKHLRRYTPEIVERATGCPKDIFLKVAQTLLENSGRERTTSFAYAVAWTQHTMGPQDQATVNIWPRKECR
jgi:formate dehydrogenase major subunit